MEGHAGQPGREGGLSDRALLWRQLGKELSDLGLRILGAPLSRTLTACSGGWLALKKHSARMKAPDTSVTPAH